MEIIRIPRIVHDTCRKHFMKGRTIGFVPTMGALHNGHLSLIKRAKNENDITVASIFVNPMQFGPAEDLEKYPRPVEDDIRKLRELETDILFLPDNTLMYPAGFSTHIDIGQLAKKLCGISRPGHFRGVATVVAKLFNITNPTRAYFGQKDFQQALIIKRMVKDLNFNVEIVVCPTIREHDGLAMSSRNLYLDTNQRRAASVLYRCLSSTSNAIISGIIDKKEIEKLMTAILSEEAPAIKVEYASVYDPETLEEIPEAKGEVLLALAVRLAETRLIDNMLLNT